MHKSGKVFKGVMGVVLAGKGGLYATHLFPFWLLKLTTLTK